MQNNIQLNQNVSFQKQSLKDLCIVDLLTQTMSVECVNGFKHKYLISTSLNASNNEINSYGTPIGKHTICEKIGEHEPMYTIFESRKSTKKIWDKAITPCLNEDLILTRILRLKGEEPGINQGFNSHQICVDTYDRYIYLHGTNHEDLLGQPVSKGCIRMGNEDIIQFFENINVGAEVNIISAGLRLKF